VIDDGALGAMSDGERRAPALRLARCGDELADLAVASSGRRPTISEDGAFLGPELSALERSLPTERSRADGPQARGAGP
jgi:hypothetical protein